MVVRLVMLYLFFAVLTTLAVGAYIVVRGRWAGARYMTMLCFLAAVYALGYLLELGSGTREQLITFNHLQYIAIPFLSAFWFLAAWHRNPAAPGLQRKQLLLFFAVPVVTLVLHATHSLQPWFYRDVQMVVRGNAFFLDISRGPWYYVQAVYHVVVFVIGSYVLLKGTDLRRPQHRKSRRLFLAAAALPLAGMLLTASGVPGWPWDYAALVFPAAIVLAVLATINFDFLDLRFAAWSEVFARADTGMLILDPSGHIVDYNQAAAEIAAAFYCPLAPGPFPDCRWADSMLNHEQLELASDDGRWYELRTWSVENDQGETRAVIKSLTDVTERRAIQEKLAVTARTDGLSGLLNREHFLAAAEKGLLASTAAGLDFCFLMIDIDHFKHINDTRGHAAGDQVIGQMRSWMEKNFPEVAICGRLGGDEFAVALVRTPLAEAVQRAEAFRRQIEQAAVADNGSSFKVTVSIGLAGGRSYPSLDALMTAADQALYRAKALGRNRVAAIRQEVLVNLGDGQ